MPLPERYARQVPDMVKIWSPEGYFEAQIAIWLAQSEARHELYGEPNADQLEEIRRELHLTPDEIDHLNNAQGHETNTLLRTVQGHMSVDAGNFLHRGNTSSDVLDTSLSMQIGRSLGLVRHDFTQLSDTLKLLALRHRGSPQIGRSHGQHAIPQTFGRQVLGWYAEVERGIGRIDHARDVIAVGKCSGEVGTNVFIEPELEELALKKLGLTPDTAPTQVISRDRHAEVVGLMAVNGVTLARIATNIRLLSMTELGEVYEGVDLATHQGSTAMPQKRNPDLAERIEGLSRRMASAFGEELDASILWLERDISHSSTERSTFPDLFGNLAYATRLTNDVINGLVINTDRMLANIDFTYGAIYSSRLLNALIDSGTCSRTEAYELVKGLAFEAMATRVHLRTLAEQDSALTSLFDKRVLESFFDPQFYLRNIDTAYRRLGILPEEE